MRARGVAAAGASSRRDGLRRHRAGDGDALAARPAGLENQAARLRGLAAVGEQPARRHLADRPADARRSRRCAARRARGPPAPASSRRRRARAARRDSSRPTPRRIAASVISRSLATVAACGSAGTAGPAPSSAISPASTNSTLPIDGEQVGAERALIDVAEGFARRGVADVGGVGRHQRQHAHRLRRQHVGLIAPLQRRSSGRPCSARGS